MSLIRVGAKLCRKVEPDLRITDLDSAALVWELFVVVVCAGERDEHRSAEGSAAQSESPPPDLRSSDGTLTVTFNLCCFLRRRHRRAISPRRSCYRRSKVKRPPPERSWGASGSVASNCRSRSRYFLSTSSLASCLLPPVLDEETTRASCDCYRVSKYFT